MKGDILAILFSILIFAFPSLISKLGKAMKKSVAAPASPNTSNPFDSSFDEPTFENDDYFGQDDDFESFDEQCDPQPAAHPFASASSTASPYFSYEYESPSETQPSENKAHPIDHSAHVQQNAAPSCDTPATDFNFDLRQAVIYQTILNNNYIADLK